MITPPAVLILSSDRPKLRCLRLLIAVLIGLIVSGLSLAPARAAETTVPAQHRLAAKVFKDHNCASCHTLSKKGQFGYTPRGIEIKSRSLGCVDLLTQMTKLTSLPQERWTSNDQAQVHDFHEFGCTQCHQMTGHGMEMTELGTKLRSAHVSCPEVEKVLNQ